MCSSSFSSQNTSTLNVYSIYAWAVISSLSYLLSAVLTINTSKDEIIRFEHVFGSPINNSELRLMLRILYSWYHEMLMISPLNTFNVFYIMIAYQIRCKLKTFPKHFSSRTKLDYDKLLRSYVSIKSLVDELDDEISCLMFGNIVYTSGFIHFILSIDLSTVLRNDYDVVFFWCSLARNLGSYVAATASASLVAKASEEIGNLAQIRAKIDKDAFSLLAQQTFIMISEKEMHFTAWKIVPIKKSFFMATIGVTVTYVLLLDNVESNKF
ncbi:uncharacterized protein TNCT_457291 [Trichonephila clavata]|uniref:Gustatory receptor n=1 Tax=Trichonephila clavata TaxID=2740835 RepID=A0A8X6LM71_TRICU|nr:uncharacterized protein TNCT_457291 [Trichonephila clavata]